MTDQLRLTYIDQDYWYKRSLAISSREWKELRLKVLVRDHNACYFCQVRATKYMIVDHISGDATDNSLKNLRVLCPMCDTIVHAGLATIEKTLTLRISKFSQLEIVRLTRSFIQENKRVPIGQEIDPWSIATLTLPIEAAVKRCTDNVPLGIEKFKAFFTEEFFKNKFSSKFLNYLID